MLLLLLLFAVVVSSVEGCWLDVVLLLVVSVVALSETSLLVFSVVFSVLLSTVFVDSFSSLYDVSCEAESTYVVVALSLLFFVEQPVTINIEHMATASRAYVVFFILTHPLL